MTIYILYCPNEIHGIRRGSKYIFFSFFFFHFFSLAGSLSADQQQLFSSFFAVQVPWACALTQESFLPRESFNGNGFANDKSLRPYHGRDVTDKKSDNSVSLKLKNRNFAWLTYVWKLNPSESEIVSYFFNGLLSSEFLRLLIYWFVYNQLESKCLT